MKPSIIVVSFLSILGIGCTPKKQLPTVDSVDLSQYIGRWYEIARLPNSFEKNLTCVTANYSIKKNGRIKVTNKGFNKQKEKWEEAIGNANVPNPDKPGELRVSFFRPFYGDYFIIELDPNYQHVLVGSPSRDYLWILSRTKELNQQVYLRYMNKAKLLGFEIDKIHKTAQNCEN